VTSIISENNRPVVQKPKVDILSVDTAVLGNWQKNRRVK